MPKLVDHVQRYEEIGKVAAIAIAEYGAENITVADIGRRAGYSKGAINHYARTKDEILLLANKFVTEDIIKRLTQVRENHSGLEALRLCLHEFLPCKSNYLRMDDNLLFVLWSKASANPDIRCTLEANTRWFQEYFRALIEEAQKTSELPTHLDAKKRAQQTLSHIGALTMNCRITGKRPPALKQIEYADEWIDFLVNCPPR